MKELEPRYSGILVHPTSFPSPYGIGDFGKGAYDFINFLVGAGQTIWQILPLGPTGYGDSPYQAFSAFAGQPLLISPDELVKSGLLDSDALADYPQFNPDHIYYGDVIPAKTRVLHRSYEYFKEHASVALFTEFRQFCEDEAQWLDDYALFMAGKDAHNGKCWLEWEDDLRNPTPAVKEFWNKKLSDAVTYYKYIQFLFFRQWNTLKEYAAVNDVKIVGDIPIFVALDSADVWANRDLFLLDSEGYPTVVAGVPPDYFSATGQLWGNPLYNWVEHKRTGYDWWMRRLKGQLRMVDYIRIDHFRGFEQFFAIPYGAKTAMEGKWMPGPREDLFRAIRETFGNEIPIWAEDLGIITPAVEKLRDDFNLPGMKVLQFAFADPTDNDTLPYRFTTSNCICYTGTHDNDTTYGWYQSLTPKLQDRVRRYLNTDANIIHWDMIRAAMSTTAKFSVYPIQDLLGFGSDCRMNTPSVAAGNWAFRFRSDHLTAQLAENLRAMTELFGRCHSLDEELEEDETVKEEDPYAPNAYEPIDFSSIERSSDTDVSDADASESAAPKKTCRASVKTAKASDPADGASKSTDAKRTTAKKTTRKSTRKAAKKE